MLQIPRWHKTSETLQRGTVEILQAQTLKVRSLAAWRITSQSVRMMRPDSEMGPLGNKSQVTNSPVDFSWHLQLVSKCFEEVCKQKSLLQFQHILASKPTLTNVDIWKNLSTWHKPFCVLCKIRPRHWTHTCYSRKRQKVASGVSQLDFFKTVLFCGDCCNRHSVHCANYSK